MVHRNKLIPPNPNGRKKGVPNKATADSRAAIALFVDNNTPRLQRWLDDIANGVINDKNEYVVKPDPVAAFRMVSDILEYHVPKLSRTEMKVSGDPDNPLQTKHTIELKSKLLSTLTDEQLKELRSSTGQLDD